MATRKAPRERSLSAIERAALASYGASLNPPPLRSWDEIPAVVREFIEASDKPTEPTA